MRRGEILRTGINICSRYWKGKTLNHFRHIGCWLTLFLQTWWDTTLKGFLYLFRRSVPIGNSELLVPLVLLEASAEPKPRIGAGAESVCIIVNWRRRLSRYRIWSIQWFFSHHRWRCATLIQVNSRDLAHHIPLRRKPLAPPLHSAHHCSVPVCSRLLHLEPLGSAIIAVYKDLIIRRLVTWTSISVYQWEALVIC